MNADKLNSFFGKSAKAENQQNVNKPTPTDKPPDSGGAANVETKDIEKDIINELAKDEKSETIRAGENASSGQEKITEGAKGVGWDGTSENVGATGDQKPVFQVVIGGQMLLYGCDAIFPKLIVWGAKKAGYKTDKKIGDFILTDDERKMMEPSADLVARQLFEHLTPLQQFCGMMAMIYGRKL